MNGLTGQQILQLFALGTGQQIIWSIFLYVCFFFAIITLFLIPDKNMLPTLTMAAVLIFIIIAKVSIMRPGTVFPTSDRFSFGVFAMNIGIGVLPIIVAGMIRSGKRKSKAQGPAILTGIFGVVYWFLYWLIVQRG
jgi:hypothetical protein